MSVLNDATDLQNMCYEGKMMEALDKYYHDDVKITEMATGEVRQGKEAQRKAIEGWFGMVKETHDGALLSVTANEDTGIACTESWIDVTFHEGGRMKMEEVAVQRWENGQIIEEKFYYNMPGQ
ncbi:MAG: nuclear transport factor 2 family protein [Cyclobacteriaceae bacterium]